MHRTRQIRTASQLIISQAREVERIGIFQNKGGASAGNGAQLSYSYVAALADPSIWRQLPHLLFSPSSPLKLRPKLDSQQRRWGLASLAARNAPMAAASRAVFDSVRAELPADIDFSATGKSRGPRAGCASRRRPGAGRCLRDGPGKRLGAVWAPAWRLPAGVPTEGLQRYPRRRQLARSSADGERDRQRVQDGVRMHRLTAARGRHG
ncbi:hypothetical protein [Variovorax sp. PAMC28562]|uniref:hypothetical protein n=1 Tax=Variovorax sp. PAMC28562 TaxID=2762323 RepID=UPI003965D638